MECFKLTAEAKLEGVSDYVEYLLSNDLKFLIFAHHHVMLDAVEAKVKSVNTKYIRIDGKTPPEARQSAVAQFQTDEATRVAVLSITACGQGLTLTAAHTVVFAELYWVPGQMIQAEDRVHRIGQQNHVDVHYCIAQGSLDNIIFNSLNRKSQDTTAVLDGKAKHLDAYKETEAGSMDNAKSRRAGADIRNLLSAGSASVATSGSNEHSEKTAGDGSASVANTSKKRPSSFAVGENTDVHSADNASSTPTPKKRGRPSNRVQSLAPRSDSQW
jgi:SNF2 family DNA or RNA helicase